MNKFLKIIFNTKGEQRFFEGYRNFFSIKEIENSTALLWVFGATLFSYFVVFSRWALSGALTVQTAMSGKESCHPYFQSCGDLYFLETLPYGYSQTTLYMGLFALLTLVVYLLHKKEYVLAHIFTLPVFLWHALCVFVLTDSYSGNYEYFLFAFAFALLILPHKQFFLKLFLILFYFLAGSIKIHEGWILGTYMSAMKTGIPVFPDSLVWLFTNIVILMEMVVVWFLLAKNKVLRNTALVLLIGFHLYSGILVGYRYPSTVLPTLIILFGMFPKYQKFPVDKKAIIGYLFALVLIGFHFTSVLIPGDEKLTLEANKYGLYMFEANHQCKWVVEVKLKDGQKVLKDGQSESARNRCDPYRYFFRYKKYCQSSDTEKVSMQFDHSINGGPFLRIVDQENICNLEYKAFQRNKWIKSEKDNPEIIGYPVQNHYR